MHMCGCTYVCVYMHVRMHVSADVHRGQKGVGGSDPLEAGVTGHC